MKITAKILFFLFLVFVGFAVSQTQMNNFTDKIMSVKLNSKLNSQKLFKSSGDIQSVNGWQFLGGWEYMSPQDSITTRSFLVANDGNYQSFIQAGGTRNIGLGHYFAGDWYKEMWDRYYSMPDSVKVKLRIKSESSSGEVIYILFIPMQDSTRWSTGYGVNLDRENNDWQVITLDRSSFKKFGLNNIGLLYFQFAVETEDSSHVILQVDVAKIEGIYGSDSVIVYDSFTLTGISSEKEIPVGFNLSQNYPNPFNPSTIIKFGLPEAGFVTLKIYDMLGREVSSLVNEYKNSGSYDIRFNSSGLASGVYLYKLRVNDFVAVKKMILLR